MVALAMNDAGLRHRVKADMQASRFTREHKLLFSDYLRGERGGILMAKMANLPGSSRERIAGLLERVRPLEFYMPMRAQRESWSGGAELVIASQLQDHTRGIAFDLGGRRIELGVDEVPSQPTMALIPVETDFSRPLSSARYKNKRDRGGETIGTLSMDSCDPQTALVPCDEYGGGGGTIVSGTAPHGTYYTAANLRGVGEGGLRGDPEIEVHAVHVYSSNLNPSEQTPFSTCLAGETLASPRRFNQDSENWTGSVLVLDSAQTLSYLPNEGTAPSRAYTVQLWEDDTDPCKLVTTLDMMDATMHMLGGGAFVLFGTTKTSRGEWGFNENWPYRLGFVALGSWVMSQGWDAFWGTNDEELGWAAERSSVPNPGHEGYTHILLMHDGARNGAITLEMR
jgi:hypothetical protein